MARLMRLLAAVALPGMMFSAAPVDAAVVYCKTMGVPKVAWSVTPPSVRSSTGMRSIARRGACRRAA